MTRKTTIQKLLSLLLTAMLCVQISSASLAGYDGAFVLTVFTNEAVLVEPVIVPYTASQSVRQAIESAGIALETEDGILKKVNGVYAGYTVCMDDGAFDLSRGASDVTVVVIGSNTRDMQFMLPLVRAMGAYKSADNHVQAYAPASEAYASALRALRTADETRSAALLDDLQSAMADYDAYLSGKRYTVHVNAMQGEQALSSPLLVFTDPYGNETREVGCDAQLVAGTYSFIVSDGSGGHVQGTLTVSDDTALTVVLPTGEWFGDLDLTDGTQPYAVEQDREARILYAEIPDCTDRVFLAAKQGADVPDPDQVLLYAVYTGTDGVDYSDVPRSWESSTMLLQSLLEKDMTAQTFTLEARYTGDDGFTAVQAYNVQIVRLPTLSSLTVSADGVRLPLSFDPLQTGYTLPTSGHSITVDAQGANPSYQVEGVGTVSADVGTHTVHVSANGKSTVYTLRFEKRDAVCVTLSCPEDITLTVTNAADAQLTGEANVYTLTAGETYTCLATRQDVYHTKMDFIAADGLQIDVPQPDLTDALSDLALYTASSPRTRSSYAFEPVFSSAGQAFTVVAEDASTVLYAQATAQSGWTVEAFYTRQTSSAETDGTPFSKTVDTPVRDTGSATMLNGCLTKSGAAQSVTFRVWHETDGVMAFRDYSVRIRRSVHLSQLRCSAGNVSLQLRDAAGETTSFTRTITAYSLEVEQDTDVLTLHTAFTDVVGGGYSARINGQQTDDVTATDVLLTDDAEQTVMIEVCHTDLDAVPVIYTIRVQKIAPVCVQISVTPDHATAFLTRDDTGSRIWPQTDGFHLMRGRSYTCIVTANGYVSRTVSFTAPQTDDVIKIALTAAPAAGFPDPLTPAQTGRDANNNGLTDAKIPFTAEDAMVYWAIQLGQGTGADACGCPILANGVLYTYAGTSVYKINPVSGEVLTTGEMDRRSGFAIQTPTYADGMLFVGLSDGAVQAFRADTLESLWIYHNPRGGQPNCPLTYCGGKLYTGFWIDEQSDADFVCLRVTDEDPQNMLEEKQACWTYTHQGGFYWAGAYAGEDFVLVGSEDGAPGSTKGYADILSLAPETGEILDTVRLPITGDVRSSVTFADGTAYFTVRSGWFCALDVTPQGTFGTLRTLRLQNGAADSMPASTSTPTIYRGRAYIGVSGASQFTAYSGHNLTVIDLHTFSIAYTVPTQGFAQTSGLLTTAYEADSGYVYVYFFDNYTPGKLRVLRDRAGQTAASYTTVENGNDTAYTLFTPYGAHAQYALCSPVADENGTLYFKNDSGFLFALGSRPLELEIVTPPDKCIYHEGEMFDSTGMTVRLTFADGRVCDVTNYIRYSASPLTTEDTQFWIEYPLALYHDAAGEAGVHETQPYAVLTLTVMPQSVLPGDADGDGKLTAADAQAIYAFLAGVRTLTPDALTLADFDGDGVVTTADAQKICAHLTTE